MIGTYISAALVCAASLLVGRSLLAALGRESWSWLEPAVGLAALFTVAGFFARAPGHATTAAIFVALLLLAAAAGDAQALPLRRRGADRPARSRWWCWRCSRSRSRSTAATG